MIPTVQVYHINLQDAMLLNGSLETDPKTTTEGENGGWVKEDASPSYNVWDDDWRN